VPYAAGARLRSRRNLIGRHDKNDKGETSKTEGQGRLTHWQPMLWYWIADAGWTQLPSGFLPPTPPGLARVQGGPRENDTIYHHDHAVLPCAVAQIFRTRQHCMPVSRTASVPVRGMRGGGCISRMLIIVPVWCEPTPLLRSACGSRPHAWLAPACARSLVLELHYRPGLHGKAELEHHVNDRRL